MKKLIMLILAETSTVAAKATHTESIRSHAQPHEELTLSFQSIRERV